MAQPLPISSFERLSATENWGDFKREALIIARAQPEFWDAIAELAENMFDGGAEAVADIRRIAEAEPTPNYRAMLAGVVSKLHALPPAELDHLIKQGEADPEINVIEEEEPEAAAVVNLPALIPLQQPA